MFGAGMYGEVAYGGGAGMYGVPASTSWSILFEVAFNIAPGAEPTPGDWTDLTSRLRTDPIDCVAGAGRLVGGQGSCALTLDNYDRLIDPSNPAATLNLVPMRHARLQAFVGATTYPLFRGFVDAWPPMWSDVDSMVQTRLVDGFAWLALQDADVDLPRQMSGQRVTALLDLAGWPAALRDISAGVVEVEPVEQASGNLLRILRDTADAEGGDLYAAPDGKITFRSRHARFNATTAITFGVGGVSVEEAEPAWDTSWLTNKARVELDDGRVFEAIDAASVTAYGPRVMPTRDLALRAAEAEAVAQWEVVRFAEMHLWVDGLTVDASEDAELVMVLAPRIGDLARVVHTPPEGGVVDILVSVERVRHTIEPNLWTATFDLSPYFGAGPWWTLDDPVLGLLDQGNVLAP